MNILANNISLKILYAFSFVIALPFLLFLWARATEQFVPLPLVGTISLGIVLALAGFSVMASAMLTLLIYGRGLPMNAFPPARFVDRGLYRLMAHPIYTGFCMCCFGTAIALQSRSGIWLVSPLVSLGCIALVEGYEKHDLAERFGASLRKPILSLPKDEDRKLRMEERLSVYILVMLPWLILYQAVLALGMPPETITAYLPFEYTLPVLDWTEIFYAGTYIFVTMVPLLTTSSRTLREFSVAGLLATGGIILLFLVFPCVALPREFVPAGFLGRLLQWERGNDAPVAAFPSFHVLWAILAARAYSRTFTRWATIAWLMAILIGLSCITTGMHAILDVVAGALSAWMFLHYKLVWEFLRLMSERIANSWKEWRIGAVRVINHGAYTGAGTAIGFMIIGSFLGSEAVIYILLITFASLIGAGLWAQYIEGSPSLLRPYGYYGGVIGVAIGIYLSHLLGGEAWTLLAAFAVAGPVIQALGRLRCLVQGCCHGRETMESIGIRYFHPRSRVCRLTSLTGVPLHPTQLYSILWNIVLVLVLSRLWFLHAAPQLITGLYLILNGLGRFVEEAYRGEPQTPLLGKLRLYQLMAITSIVAGTIVSSVETNVIIPNVQFNSMTFVAAVGSGIFIWFAQGVDFPNSNRRFSRLV